MVMERSREHCTWSWPDPAAWWLTPRTHCRTSDTLLSLFLHLQNEDCACFIGPSEAVHIKCTAWNSKEA